MRAQMIPPTAFHSRCRVVRAFRENMGSSVPHSGERTSCGAMSAQVSVAAIARRYTRAGGTVESNRCRAARSGERGRGQKSPRGGVQTVCGVACQKMKVQWWICCRCGARVRPGWRWRGQPLFSA